MSIRLALAVSVFFIAAAPFIGRWRAKMWLKKNMHAEMPVKTATTAVKTA